MHTRDGSYELYRAQHGSSPWLGHARAVSMARSERAKPCLACAARHGQAQNFFFFLKVAVAVPCGVFLQFFFVHRTP